MSVAERKPYSMLIKKMYTTIFGLFKYIYFNESNRGQKIKRFVLCLCWQIYKRVIKLPLIVTLDNKKQFVIDPASRNSTGVIYTRIYEPEYTLFLRTYFSKYRGQMAIDVGAHVGLFSLQLSHLFNEIHCFEPASDNYKFLLRNIGINVHSNMIPYNVAVSDNTGKAMFALSGDFSEMNKIIESNENCFNEKRIEVQTVSLDSIFDKEEYYSKIAFLKIDTEGHESQVLLGAQKIIKNNPDIIILVENNNSKEINSLCEVFGLSKYAISPGGCLCTDANKMKNAYNIVITKVAQEKLVNA
jgi:FkbM family methyltransferase